MVAHCVTFSELSYSYNLKQLAGKNNSFLENVDNIYSLEKEKNNILLVNLLNLTFYCIWPYRIWRRAQVV